LHHFLLFLLDDLLLLSDLLGHHSSSLRNLLATHLIGLLFGDLLFKLDTRLAFVVQPMEVLHLLLLAEVVLLGFHTEVASLLVLAHEDRLLDFGLLDVALLTDLVDALAILLRNHHIVLHLIGLCLHALVVSLFELENLRGALLGFLNFLPRLDLFLLEKGNTVGKQLCVTVNTVKIVTRCVS
jgi:hypothetical protein